MRPVCLINGAVADLFAAHNRGLAYGDGLFETVAVADRVPRFWQAHMDRLAAGCERLRISMPAQATLLQETRLVAYRQGLCVVKIIITRGRGGRGYRPAIDVPADRVVSAYEFPSGVGRAARDGLPARVLSMRLALQPALGGIKHLNRLEQVLAGAELADAPGTEGILLDTEGYLISALAGNLFLVSGSRLLTPRMDRCGVRGVLRGLILRDFKSRTEQRRVARAMLADTDEVFTCSAVRGITPLTAINELRWPIGEVTRELQDWFREQAQGP